MNLITRMWGWIVVLSFFVSGCKSSELGATPEIPVVPSSIYSKKSICFTGSSSVAGVDAFQLLTDPPASLPVSDITFSFWIKMENENTSGMILSMEFTGTYFRLSWVGQAIEYRTFANGTLDVITTGDLNTTAWNHIVVSYDGFNAVPNLRKAIYVNGEIAAQSTAPIEYFPGTGKLFQLSPTSDPLSEGCLDDIYVWHRQITTSEVIELYGNGQPNALTGTLVDASTAWLAEQDLDAVTLNDSFSAFNSDLHNGTFIKSNLTDPFLNPDLNGDPLDSGTVGDNQDGSSSGSGVFDGGSGGFGGELGDGGSAGSAELFP